MDITLAIIWIILTAAIFVIVIGAFYLIYKTPVAKPPVQMAPPFHCLGNSQFDFHAVWRLIVDHQQSLVWYALMI